MPRQRLADAATLYTGLLAQGRGLVCTGDCDSETNPCEGPPDLRLISYKHIQGGRVVAALDDRHAPDVSRLARHRVRQGDVLIAARGAEPKVAIASKREEGAFITTMVIGLRPTRVCGEVLWSYLASDQGQAHLKGLNQGTTSMLSLSTKTLSEMLVPIPRARTQARIAALVHGQAAWDAVAEEAVRKRRNLAQAAIHAALQEDSP